MKEITVDTRVLDMSLGKIEHIKDCEACAREAHAEVFISFYGIDIRFNDARVLKHLMEVVKVSIEKELNLRRKELMT